MEEILYREQVFPEVCYHFYIGSELYITMSIFLPIPIDDIKRIDDIKGFDIENWNDLLTLKYRNS